MSFGSNRVDWLRSFHKNQQVFFAPQVARTALGRGFRTSFVDRNQNCENASNMSFGLNGLDWVHSFSKNQQQVFSLHKWPERPSRTGFARVLSTETETTKTHQT
jgi:hypothetical protein